MSRFSQLLFTWSPKKNRFEGDFALTPNVGKFLNQSQKLSKSNLVTTNLFRYVEAIGHINWAAPVDIKVDRTDA
jgi:hypothetical protein